jgi:hypothetical protein
MSNITEETKRDPERINLEFYINENHQWFLVDWNGTNKNYTQIDNLTNAEVGKLIINSIKDCL